ncbi:hypothetical protein F4777DRAFT_584760 [Nemania sp. FL0916]|nr:hypothetical protein F4777DRAFT_584760 [Nemania sp. FL0916]
MNERLSTFEQRLKQGLKTVDERLGSIDQRLVSLDQGISNIEDSVEPFNNVTLPNIRGRMDELVAYIQSTHMEMKQRFPTANMLQQQVDSLENRTKNRATNAERRRMNQR